MTGDNSNRVKIKEKREKRIRRQSGQVLLITIMLIAVVLTVVLSISFTSKTETQLTKLEEENQKTLAAAEAGIEAVLKGDVGTTVAIGGLAGLSNFTGTATVSNTTGPSFVSPLVPKDQQYTFYLSDYSSATGVFSNYYPGTISVYYGKQGDNCSTMALEITFLSGTSPNYVLTRYISDSGNLLGGDRTKDKSGGSGGTVSGENFVCNTSAIALPAQPDLLFVRAFFVATKVGIVGSTNLNNQGKTITSEAKSPSGVTKRVVLFQSLPQLPADFFITSF